MSDYQTNSDQWPEHAAAPNTHNRVFELVSHYLPDASGVKVADLPCGAFRYRGIHRYCC